MIVPIVQKVTKPRVHTIINPSTAQPTPVSSESDYFRNLASGVRGSGGLLPPTTGKTPSYTSGGSAPAPTPTSGTSISFSELASKISSGEIITSGSATKGGAIALSQLKAGQQLTESQALALRSEFGKSTMNAFPKTITKEEKTQIPIIKEQEKYIPKIIGTSIFGVNIGIKSNERDIVKEFIGTGKLAEVIGSPFVTAGEKVEGYLEKSFPITTDSINKFFKMKETTKTTYITQDTKGNELFREDIISTKDIPFALSRAEASSYVGTQVLFGAFYPFLKTTLQLEHALPNIEKVTLKGYQTEILPSGKIKTDILFQTDDVKNMFGYTVKGKIGKATSYAKEIPKSIDIESDITKYIIKAEGFYGKKGGVLNTQTGKIELNIQKYFKGGQISAFKESDVPISEILYGIRTNKGLFGTPVGNIKIIEVIKGYKEASIGQIQTGKFKSLLFFKEKTLFKSTGYGLPKEDITYVYGKTVGEKVKDITYYAGEIKRIEPKITNEILGLGLPKPFKAIKKFRFELPSIKKPVQMNIIEIPQELRYRALLEIKQQAILKEKITEKLLSSTLGMISAGIKETPKTLTATYGIPSYVGGIIQTPNIATLSSAPTRTQEFTSTIERQFTPSRERLSLKQQSQQETRLREELRPAFKEETLLRTREDTRLRFRLNEKLSFKQIEKIIIKVPPPTLGFKYNYSKIIIPKFSSNYPRNLIKSSRSGRIRESQVYSPDFTAKVLGISKRYGSKQLKSLVTKQYSGLEIRPQIIPRHLR